MAYVDTQATHNPTTGQVIPASWGDIVRDDLEYLGRNKPHSRVYKSTAFSHTSSGSFLAVTFDTERLDVGALHSTVSNTSRFTITDPGFYRVGGCIQWNTNGTGRRLVKLRVNGTTDIAQQELPVSSNESGGIVETDYQFAAGDYVEMHAFQSSGGTLTILATGNLSPEFWIEWVCI